MAYAKFVGDSAYFYVGAERIINNGDTHIDFELNKNPWTVFPGAGGVAKPDRSVGDLILSLEFANGGANPEMTVYKVTAVSDCLNGGKKAGEDITVSDVTKTAGVHSATELRRPRELRLRLHRPPVRVRRGRPSTCMRVGIEPGLPRPVVRLRAAAAPVATSTARS
jgi:hypothetical protein